MEVGAKVTYIGKPTLWFYLANELNWKGAGIQTFIEFLI